MGTSLSDKLILTGLSALHALLLMGLLLESGERVALVRFFLFHLQALNEHLL